MLPRSAGRVDPLEQEVASRPASYIPRMMCTRAAPRQ